MKNYHYKTFKPEYSFLSEGLSFIPVPTGDEGCSGFSSLDHLIQAVSPHILDLVPGTLFYCNTIIYGYSKILCHPLIPSLYPLSVAFLDSDAPVSPHTLDEKEVCNG
jgi:hypothetical protein